MRERKVREWPSMKNVDIPKNYMERPEDRKALEEKGT